MTWPTRRCVAPKGYARLLVIGFAWGSPKICRFGSVLTSRFPWFLMVFDISREFACFFRLWFSHFIIFDEHMILSHFISTGGVARFLSSALIWLTAKINGRHHGLKLLKCLAMIRIHWMSKRPRVYFIPMRLWSKDLISWVFDLEHNLATSWAASWRVSTTKETKAIREDTDQSEEMQSWYWTLARGDRCLKIWRWKW